jgi:hypothetical protein
MFRLFAYFAQFVAAVMKHAYAVIGLVLTIWPLFIAYVPASAVSAIGRLLSPQHYSALGVCLLFFAAFRAWDEQRDIAEKASPEEVRRELGALRAEAEERKRLEWPRLTVLQKTELVKRLRKIGTNPVWLVRPNVRDCVALADDFAESLRAAAWCLPEKEPYTTGTESLGICIQGALGPTPEALQTAIREVTKLPISMTRSSDDREYDGKRVIVLSVGLKRG